MQFMVSINQSKSIAWGLNVQQSLLFAFLHNLPTWASVRMVNEIAYSWITKSKIIEELPLLTDKNDTVYRNVKSLEDRGLIEKKSLPDGMLIRVTNKGLAWNIDKETTSEKNPTRLGKKSDVPSEKNPTYQYTNYQNTKSKEKIEKNVAGGNDTAKRVFEYWSIHAHHQKAVMDKKRLARIKSMLKMFSEDDLKEAIYGVTLSPFHMGENKDNRKYTGIETIFRDAAQVENFMEISRKYQEE